MYKFLGNSDIFSIGFSMFGFVKSFEKNENEMHHKALLWEINFSLWWSLALFQKNSSNSTVKIVIPTHIFRLLLDSVILFLIQILSNASKCDIVLNLNCCIASAVLVLPWFQLGRIGWSNNPQFLEGKSVLKVQKRSSLLFVQNSS